MRARVLVPVLGVLATVVAILPPAGAAPDPPAYVPPVPGPVTEAFDPPSTPYGPGHRGLSYQPPPGSPVRASAEGVVTFAGSVAGSRHVTLRHGDGVRTTYSYLATVDVVVGQRVRQGDPVGTAGERFQLGARRGDAYFDPATLFAGRPPAVRLVPFDDPPGAGPAGERSAIGQLIDGAGALGGRAADWLRATGGTVTRTAAHYTARFAPGWAALRNGLTLLDAFQDARRRSERPCTAAAVALPPPPAERRVAVLVAGLGSNSRNATIEHLDTVGLGYDGTDVLRFSYAGGRTPDPSDGFPSIVARDYGPAETQDDLRATGSRLADVIEQVAADAPGAPVDLLAHSQGGVVTRLALIELERRHGTAWLDRLGLVVTFGTPHDGADLATAVHAWSTTTSGGTVLDAYRTASGMDLDADATSVEQLSEGSDVVEELRTHPIPASVDAVAVAARGDWVVPVPRAAAPGATTVVLPLVGRAAHSDMVGSPLAQREVALALAGLPPGCQTLGDALLDAATGEVLSFGEDVLGASGWVAGWWLDARRE